MQRLTQPSQSMSRVATVGPILSDYDWIVINTSAGKDSQAMTELIVRMARKQGIADRVVMVHADLGKAEWAGTRELAQYHAVCRGVRFEVVERGQDLLSHVEERGMWPDSGNRYCTSDHKRDQVAKLFTRLAAESGRSVRILNCMGLRADESPARAKRLPFSINIRSTNGKRQVWDWLPLHGYTEAQVWEVIEAGGMPHHYAYDLGMPRLSCCFCIFAPPAALMIAGYHNRQKLASYVGVEDRSGHTFRHRFALRSIQDRLQVGEEPPVNAESWRCA